MAGILSLVILVSLAFVNVSYLQVLLKYESEMKPKELCSPVTSGLKFCTDAQKIMINSGKAIILHFSLINTSDKETRVKTNRDLSKYSIKVTDENGEKLLTKLERKSRDNAMTYDDQKDFINSIFRDHRSEVLKPDQMLSERLDISEIYDFTHIGKYYVEIARKTSNPKGEGFIEIPLEKIEIEVK